MKKLFLFLAMFLMLILSVSANPTLPSLGPYVFNETDTVVIEFDLTAQSDNGSTVWWTDSSDLTASPLNNDTHAKYTWVTDYNDAGVYNIMFNATDDNSSDSTTATLTIFYQYTDQVSKIVLMLKHAD